MQSFDVIARSDQMGQHVREVAARSPLRHHPCSPHLTGTTSTVVCQRHFQQATVSEAAKTPGGSKFRQCVLAPSQLERTHRALPSAIQH